MCVLPWSGLHAGAYKVVCVNKIVIRASERAASSRSELSRRTISLGTPRMSLKKHFGWSAAAALVLAGSRFGLSSVLARRLSVQEYGQFTYAQWLADISFLLLSFGMTGAVSRYSAEFRHFPAKLGTFMRQWRRYAYVPPIAAAGASVCGALISGVELSPVAFCALAAWTLASGLWAMQTAALTGMQRFDLIFKSNILAAAVMLSGAATLPIVQKGVWLAYALMAVACGTGFLVGLREVARAAGGGGEPISPAEIRSMRSYAKNTWVTAILWSVAWSRGELPVVRAYLGNDGVAQYSAALTLVGGAVAGVMLGIGGVAPQVTRYLGEGNRPQALKLCRRVGDLHLLICGFAGLVLIWLAPQLSRLAFGPAYLGSAKALAILGLGIPVLGVSILNHLLQMETDSRFNRNSTLLGVAVLYAAALLFVPTLHIEAAAIARVSALLVMGVTTVAYANRLSPDRSSLANFGRVIFICLASLLVSTHLGQEFSPVRVIGLITSIGLSLLVIRQPEGRTVIAAEWRVLARRSLGS